MSVDDVTEILAVDLIGTILDDEQIVIATNQGEPLSGKGSQAEEEYQNICRRFGGEKRFLSATLTKKRDSLKGWEICSENKRREFV